MADTYKITIDNTKIDSNLTDFPLTVKIDNTFAGWDLINNDSGNVYFTDSSGNILPHEIEYNGKMVYESGIEVRDAGLPTGVYPIDINGTVKDIYVDNDNNGGGWMLYASFATDNQYSQPAITKSRMLEPEFNTYGFDLNYATNWSDGINGTLGYTRRSGWFAFFYSGSPYGQFTMTSYQGPTNVSEMRATYGGGSTSYSGASGYVLVNNSNQGTAPNNPTGTRTIVASFNPSGSTPLFRAIETGIFGMSDIWVR